MSDQQSFTKYENEILPEYRQKMSQAESTEDVKKFFVYSCLDLLGRIFSPGMSFEYEDISLNPDGEVCYTLHDRLLDSADFSDALKNSDLSNILTRLSAPAVNRYHHLDKNPAKTNAKIRG
ncbi:MAG: hypothetical protein PF442_04040 [Desulfobulbaceae bacterium]|jgi:hypothetical protein|nr:hypothetical protein [Desulfobulbaceae bacterium]